jgi:hypothetical protein
MNRRRFRSLFVKAFPVLLPIAIIGYLIGGSVSHTNSSSADSAVASRALAAVNTVVLEYPSSYGWAPPATVPRIPGMSLTDAFALAPSGQGTRVGLVAGQLTDGQLSATNPLPTKLLASYPNLGDKGEVVSLLDTQAYRYEQPGNAAKSQARLVLYAIPFTAAANTMIACYAPAEVSYASYLSTCEQIAGQLTLQGGSQSQMILTPDAGYGQGVRKLLAKLQGLRSSTRATLRSQQNQPRFAPAANRLAQGFSEARRALVSLQPPTPAAPVHTELAGALAEAGSAYGQLASAAEARDVSGYALARERVKAAEGKVEAALRDYSLVGYG